MSALRTVAALIAAMTLLQLAQGLLAVHLPLTQREDGVGAGGVGLIGAMYSAGFMAGAFLAPRLLARVGHIRVFCAGAAGATSALLAAHWAFESIGWAMARFVMGFALAAMFASAESWMNGSLKAGERGGVIGFYLVCTKAAAALGPLLLVSAAPGGPEPLILGAAILILAILPIAATTQEQPEAPKPQPVTVKELISIAPAAVTACFLAGVVNASVLALVPLYAAEHYGAAHVGAFYAAAMVGSLLLQWPAGRLSDRVDRRLVIAGLALIAAGAALPLALFEAQLPFWAGAALYALFGAGAYSYYGISVAHMADRAAPEQIARATAGLLFVWAGGSVAGPVILGLLVQLFGAAAVFWFGGAGSLILAAAMVWRRVSREPAARGPRSGFTEKGATSTAAVDLVLGEKGGKPAP